MRSSRVRLDRSIASLDLLGVASELELLDETRSPSSRAVVLARDRRRTRIRFPLPGTPDDGSRVGEAARGGGTGWVVLERFTGASLAALLFARFTRPRSASLAERAWNLACHLRAHGVGTPELLAVGARGRGLVARESFLVLRDLAGFQALPDWLAETRDPGERRRGLVSLGKTLHNLALAGVELPELAGPQVFLSVEGAQGPQGNGDVGDAACALGAIAALRSSSVHGRLSKNRLPSVAIAGFEGGRLVPAPAIAASDRLLRRLAKELAPRCSGCELARVFLAFAGPLDLSPKGARELRRRFSRVTS